MVTITSQHLLNIQTTYYMFVFGDRKSVDLLISVESPFSNWLGSVFFGNFLLRIVSVLGMFRLEIMGILHIIDSTNSPSMQPVSLTFDRLGICRDRRDRRSCKIFVSCVNFFRKQRSFLLILQVYTHLNVNFLHNC